jgi:hypothetical protein
VPQPERLVVPRGDLLNRRVAESYKDYADRMAGHARACQLDRDRLQEQRDAALNIHVPEVKQVQAGPVTVCRHCGHQLWPCFTAKALGAV